MFEQYPIGAIVVFKPSVWESDVVREDNNKVGRLVGISWVGHPLIVLPGSTHESDHSTKGCFVTWETTWDSIVPVKKNQQLLFDFAYEER